MNKTIKELKEFLKTLKIHNKELGVCFNDALAGMHIERLFKEALEKQKQEIIKIVEKEKELWLEKIKNKEVDSYTIKRVSFYNINGVTACENILREINRK